MVVTELALLRLLPPTTADDTALRSKLANAKAVMENYTNRRFYFAQQIEDPGLVYVIGEWDSLGQHMEEFIPSEANQALLDSVKDELTVEWLLHIDVPHEDLPLAKAVRDVEHSDVLSIRRYFVLDGKRDDVEGIFEEKKQGLQGYLNGSIGGGWRVDPENSKVEFVLLCSCLGVEQRNASEQTDQSKEYAQMGELLTGEELRHAKILDL